jgi:GNAT superfamily N-acetyltransferase
MGIGHLLLEKVEKVARDAGCQELALDTAQPAEGLIAYYRRRGFEIVGQADWRPTTNYESWIMAKKLEE